MRIAEKMPCNSKQGSWCRLGRVEPTSSAQAKQKSLDGRLHRQLAASQMLLEVALEAQEEMCRHTPKLGLCLGQLLLQLYVLLPGRPQTQHAYGQFLYVESIKTKEVFPATLWGD